MPNPLPISDELWSQVPRETQAAIAAVFVVTQQRIHDLENRVNDFGARLKLNSTNSHKPPSSDFLGTKRKPPAPARGKKRGGQPKLRKADRVLVPPQNARETLTGDDPTPLIHQVAELPKVEPIVDGGSGSSTLISLDEIRSNEVEKLGSI